MASRTWLAAAVAVALTAACDVSQKTPQTQAPSNIAGGPMPGGTVGVAREGATSQLGHVSTGEKSIRLHGRGVSRARQIRV